MAGLPNEGAQIGGKNKSYVVICGSVYKLKNNPEARSTLRLAIGQLPRFNECPTAD
jgi:hypothetical protein